MGKQPEHSQAILRFYRATFIGAVLYFVTLPMMCILAVAMDPWNRKKVVSCTELASRFVATAILAWVLRPSRLDTMINARLETPDNRQNAVEMARGLSDDPELIAAKMPA